MLAQDLCIHTLQLSHATALCDQLTVSWHTAQGNIAFSVGPGLRAMSPESAKMIKTAKDDGALSGRVVVVWVNPNKTPLEQLYKYCP